MPILTTILGIAAAASAASGVAGAVEGAQAGGRQQKALTIQEQIAQQEAADKQKAFQQAEDFYTPYTKSGSPFLQNIQAASAGQNAKAANDAAGTFRSEMGTTGVGFGPSGATAAGLANIGSNAASTSAGDYLTNLLNNEQVKFQAEQGITSAGGMAGGSQNQPNVSAQLPYQSLGSGMTGFAQMLQNLMKSGGSGPGNTVPGTLPTTGPGTPTAPPIPTMPGPAATTGWGVEGDF